MTTIKYIVHTADWHLHNKNRHNVFEGFVNDFLDKIQNLFENPKEVAVYAMGDLTDNFTTVSNQSVLLLYQALRRILDVCGQLHIIAGNHDVMEKNIHTTMDSITPVVEILKTNPLYGNRVFYYTDSLVYPCENFCVKTVNVVCSIFEEHQLPKTHLEEVENGTLKLGLFHAPLIGSKLFYGQSFEGRFDANRFEDLDAVLMGDVHKYQTVWGYRENNTGAIPCVYSGSPYQLNIGESVNGHGFVAWDLQKLHKIVNGESNETISNSYKFVEIPNRFSLYKVTLDMGSENPIIKIVNE